MHLEEVTAHDREPLNERESSELGGSCFTDIFATTRMVVDTSKKRNIFLKLVRGGCTVPVGDPCLPGSPRNPWIRPCRLQGGRLAAAIPEVVTQKERRFTFFSYISVLFLWKSTSFNAF